MKKTTPKTDDTAPAVPDETPTKPIPPVHPLIPMRRRAVPLVGIETADPASTIAAVTASLNGKAIETPILAWDCCQGLHPTDRKHEPSKEALNAILMTDDGNPLDPSMTLNPTECLILLRNKVPGKAIVFFHNAHLILKGQGNEPILSNIQAVWNCRDPFAGRAAMLVLMAPMFSLPTELQRDVVLITEPLPTRAELGAVADKVSQDAELPEPTGEERKHVIDTLTGLSTFEASQTVALSLTPKGIDRAELWKRKVRAIEATQGLTVYRGKETFKDIGGNRNAIKLMGDTLRGQFDCTCLVFCDELDKSMAAAGTDSSGTTQDQNKALLSYLQDYDALAALFLGPPGTGKTLLAKALAGEFQIPLIMLDLGALKGSLVGQSEQNTRAAIRIIHAISEGKAFWIGACNRDAGLPPELRRRFSYQLLFYDLPDREEKDAAWNVHTNRLRFRGDTYALRQDQTDRAGLNDDGWTGAEIRNCALKAYTMNTTLIETAKTIVPISKSAGDVVTQLRRTAHNRYISASKPGLYKYDGAQGETETQPTAGRKMDLRN